MTKLPLCVVFFLAAKLSFGQTPFFQSYALLKKNEHVKINKVFQDKIGFVWFGTDKGLFKFDGFKYQHYTVEDGLPVNEVTAVAEDSVGRIWTGHATGQLAFLENKTFKKFVSPEGNAVNQISDILFDRKGNLWFSTLGDGLYYYTRNNRLYRLDDIDGIPDLFIYDIELDKQERVWAGTDRGFAICSMVNSTVEVKSYDATSGLIDIIIKKIAIIEGKAWLGSEDHGIISFTEKQGVFKSETVNWNFGAINDFIINEDGAFISLNKKGFLIYNLGNGRTVLYGADTKESFASTNSLLQDKEGNIWLGASDEAIRLPNYILEEFRLSYTSKSNSIVTLAVGVDGGLWYSKKGKLFFQNATTTGTQPAPWKFPSVLDNKYVSSLYADSKGFIWVGFFGGGVAKINVKTNQLYYFEELKNTSVLSITGREADIWVASLTGAVNINTGESQPRLKFYNRTNGLSTDYIYQVFEDSQSRVWFATDGKGVDMLDDKGIHHYQEGLSSKVVYGFAEDGKHRIWINTQGYGLYTYGADSKFKPLVSKNGKIRTNDISCLTTDRRGNLVAAHENGLDIYEVTENRIFHIGSEIELNKFNPVLNAVSVSTDGSIYFGTDNDIVRYYPHSNPITIAPLPVIENIKALNTSYTNSEELNFDYDQNDIAINYLGLWFQNPGNIVYQYKLEGHDKDWIESHDRTVMYSSLPPGDYTFHLKVSDTNFFNNSETTWSFVIAPPFWKTGWFYSVAMVALGFISFTGIKYRERKLLRENRELEMKVAERTLEIRAMNDEIRAQAEEISGINENLEGLVKSRTSELEKKNKALEEYAFITAHQLRAPLASILGLVNILSQIKLDEGDQEIVNRLKQSSENLNRIVRSITEAIEKGDEPSLLK